MSFLDSYVTNVYSFVYYMYLSTLSYSVTLLSANVLMNKG